MPLRHPLLGTRGSSPSQSPLTPTLNLSAFRHAYSKTEESTPLNSNLSPRPPDTPATIPSYMGQTEPLADMAVSCPSYSNSCEASAFGGH